MRLGNGTQHTELTKRCTRDKGEGFQVVCNIWLSASKCVARGRDWIVESKLLGTVSSTKDNAATKDMRAESQQLCWKMKVARKASHGMKQNHVHDAE